MRVPRVVVVAVLISCLGCTGGLKVGAFLGAGADATLPSVIDASDVADGIRDAGDVLIGEPGVDAAKPCLAISPPCSAFDPNGGGAVMLTITNCGSTLSGSLTVWSTAGTNIVTDSCSGLRLKEGAACTLYIYRGQSPRVPMDPKIDVSDGLADACTTLHLDGLCSADGGVFTSVDGAVYPAASNGCSATPGELDAAATGG